MKKLIILFIVLSFKAIAQENNPQIEPSVIILQQIKEIKKNAQNEQVEKIDFNNRSTLNSPFDQDLLDQLSNLPPTPVEDPIQKILDQIKSLPPTPSESSFKDEQIQHDSTKVKKIEEESDQQNAPITSICTCRNILNHFPAFACIVAGKCCNCSKTARDIGLIAENYCWPCSDTCCIRTMK